MEKSRARKRNRTPSEEKKDDPRDSDKPIGDDYYRCPACGALVNGRDRAERQLHHQHVLFPKRSAARGGDGAGRSERAELGPGGEQRAQLVEVERLRQVFIESGAETLFDFLSVFMPGKGDGFLPRLPLFCFDH